MSAPIDPAEANVMAETVGRFTESQLGSTLNAIAVRYFPSEARAIVWVELGDPSFDGQLSAVSAFSNVRECYEDELELELRFGMPAEDVAASVRAQVYAHSA